MFKVYFLSFYLFFSSPLKISSYDLYKKNESGDNIYLFDARLLEEYEEYRIFNSIWVGEKNVLLKILENIDKNSEIYIYCDYESRSEQVYKILKNKKFKNLYILSGGLTNWKNEGFPLDDFDLKN